MAALRIDGGEDKPIGPRFRGREKVGVYERESG
jgi:hypothetical protein